MRSMHKKNIILISFTLIGLVLLVLCVRNIVSGGKSNQNKVEEKQCAEIDQSFEENGKEAMGERVLPSVEIEDFYITNTGDAANLYYIDENNVLWGCGKNECGQLGQGTQDYNFHENMTKIAENVIHVDYSRHDFVIYLTKEHKLYGLGTAGRGALQQLKDFSYEQYTNSSSYPVSTPVLLMEDVQYARCGRDDIVCLKEDSSVWTWGTIWYDSEQNFYYEKDPVKVLEDTVLVTGGMFNHAALMRNGSVWTWGYNYSGNCGIEGNPVISKPQLVAEDVIMVWTGSLKYDVDCLDISEFNGFYEKQLENTIIQKSDGSYWICGAGIGNEEKVLPYYYEVVDYTMTCTHEFFPYDGEIN